MTLAPIRFLHPYPFTFICDVAVSNIAFAQIGVNSDTWAIRRNHEQRLHFKFILVDISTATIVFVHLISGIPDVHSDCSGWNDIFKQSCGKLKLLSPTLDIFLEQRCRLLPSYVLSSELSSEMAMKPWVHENRPVTSLACRKTRLFAADVAEVIRYRLCTCTTC